MNATDVRPPTAKEVEDAAEAVHVRVRQAADHATLGDYRKAHAEAEQAQGAARRLKELLAPSAVVPPDRYRDEDQRQQLNPGQPDRQTKFTE